MEMYLRIASVVLAACLLAGCGDGPMTGGAAASEPHTHDHDHGHDHGHEHDHEHDHDDADMHDLMAWVLDPAAGIIWRAAGTIDTLEGTEELTPTTDEGWDRVRHAAAVISESGRLLMLPGRARDDTLWRTTSQAMTEIGDRTATAVRERDPEAIFDLGGELYSACLACHETHMNPEPADASAR